MTGAKASTCCGKGNSECACGTSPPPPTPPSCNPRKLTSLSVTAKQATCSCGKNSAMHCTCSKAPSENDVSGPRCSCRARPAGECTCDRAAVENATVTGSKCSCGARPADACTCEKAADGGFNPANEVDFTNLK
ncbi:hypothetical protein S40288_01835 [Stachybotrys chartarum IBT 40288]|nr:hypothetical protein S40288_01835 [Stachybotrys chartarum IBT 40288]